MMTEEEGQEIKAKIQAIANDLAEHCSCVLIMGAIDDDTSIIDGEPAPHTFFSRRGGWHASLGLAKDFDKKGVFCDAGSDMRYRVQCALNRIAEDLEVIIVLCGLAPDEDNPKSRRCFDHHGVEWAASGLCDEYRDMQFGNRQTHVDNDDDGE
jgi:hypothetical protein